MSQIEAILRYMMAHDCITHKDAEKACGCTRLSARIWDLRNTFAVPIERKMVTVKTRRGKTQVAAYSLISKASAIKALGRMGK